MGFDRYLARPWAAALVCMGVAGVAWAQAPGNGGGAGGGGDAAARHNAEERRAAERERS